MQQLEKSWVEFRREEWLHARTGWPLALPVASTPNNRLNERVSGDCGVRPRPHSVGVSRKLRCLAIGQMTPDFYTREFQSWPNGFL